MNKYNWLDSLKKGYIFITIVLAIVLISYYAQLNYDMYKQRQETRYDGDTLIEWGTYNYIVNSEENPARAQLELDKFNKQYDIVTITGKVTRFSSISNICASMEINGDNNSILFYLTIDDMARLNKDDIITIKGKFEADYSYVSVGSINKPAKLISIK